MNFLNINVINLTTQKECQKLLIRPSVTSQSATYYYNVHALTTPCNYNLAYLQGDIYNIYVWYAYFSGDHQKLNYAICHVFLQLVYCSGKT
jgi:hypothetical protein